MLSTGSVGPRVQSSKKKVGLCLEQRPVHAVSHLIPRLLESVEEEAETLGEQVSPESFSAA